MVPGTANRRRILIYMSAELNPVNGFQNGEWIRQNGTCPGISSRTSMDHIKERE